MTGGLPGYQAVPGSWSSPLAPPVWRPPVLRLPWWLHALVWLPRLLWRLTTRRPALIVSITSAFLAWHLGGWPGPVMLAAAATAVAITWRQSWPASWSRYVLGPWRRLAYRRSWPTVMAVAGLAVGYRGQLLLPRLGAVVSTGDVDRIHAGLVPGQSAKEFSDRSDNLAHGFGAQSCRIRVAEPGSVVIELIRRDALAAVVRVGPIPDRVDLRAVQVGRREDGIPWTIRLHGTHVLIAGASGAGKASLLWGIIRGILPSLADGTARILGADPKLMELAYGRALFDAYGRYESDAAAILAMLEDAVAGMQRRAGELAGRLREHAPSAEHPFTVVVIDEVAFLTAYQPDRKLRERALAAIATLTTQGRAVGYCIVAALQDPRKDVLAIRNLFPDRIAMRLDEPEQVDMVLGHGSRDRGATADLIPSNPATGAGIAWIRLGDEPNPVRARAAWITDDDIAAMCHQYGSPLAVAARPAWPGAAA